MLPVILVVATVGALVTNEVLQASPEIAAAIADFEPGPWFHALLILTLGPPAVTIFLLILEAFLASRKLR